MKKFTLIDKIRYATINALSSLFPDICVACNSASERGLCMGCEGVYKVSPPFCPMCKKPFPLLKGALDPQSKTDLSLPPQHLCSDCIEGRFFDELYVPFIYEGGIKEAIHQLKYSSSFYVAKRLSPYLSRLIKFSGNEWDILLPIPLHRAKLIHRGYNQSALIAKEVSRETGIPVDFNFLIRVRNTPPLYVMSRKQREGLLRGAFQIRGGFDIRDKRVLIIDDIFTTGTTVNEVAGLLRKNGAGYISVGILAR